MAAQEIATALIDLASKNTHVFVALSGGSTPKDIYQLLGTSPLVETLPWKKLIFFLGDERFVLLDDPRSNWNMISHTLLQNSMAKESGNLFPLDMTQDTVEGAARAYEETIRKTFALSNQSSANAVPVFHLMLLGVGDDGHTASLFPKDAAVDVTDHLCVSVTHPTDGTKRMSMTKPLIQAAGKIIYFAKGDSKANILHEIIAGSASINTYPARLWTEVSEKVEFLLDEPAASKVA